MRLKKTQVKIAVLAVALVVALCSAVRIRELTAVFGDSQAHSRAVVIIDAGHGGPDGGTTSISGVTESGINLQVSMKYEALLNLYGYETVMIRTKDVWLASDDAKTLREKKSSDLRNRVKIINSYTDAILVSIHQNSFTQSKYSGAQVFYANTDGSLELAQITQELLRDCLNPRNNRRIKPAGDSIYLMENVKCAAILVECGFLSNPEEDQLLQDRSYQTRIAMTLTKALFDYKSGAAGT